MRATADTDLLGSLSPFPISAAQTRAHNADLASQIREFFARAIREFAPDIVITVERKGTALFRLFNSDLASPPVVPWSRLLASPALSTVDPTRLVGKRILVCDDMARTGAHIVELLTQLADCGVDTTSSSRLNVAVFAMHEGASGVNARTYCNRPIPDRWFVSGLGTRAYAALRLAIIELLHSSGAMNLNTEHVEFRLRVFGDPVPLCNALGRSGHTVYFDSGSGRFNATVFYGSEAGPRLDLAELPPGIETRDIVKKCRLVQRGPTSYSLIPLCLPSVPSKATAWLGSDRVTDLLGPDVPRKPQALFYATALVGALQVLRVALRDLHHAPRTLFEPSLPLGTQGDDHHQSLEYMTTIYPTLRLDRLSAAIRNAWTSSKAEASVPSVHRAGHNRTTAIDARDVRRTALALLTQIGLVIDYRKQEQRLEGVERAASGLVAREVFSLGRRMSIRDEMISAAFDVLIDEGYLVTRVHRAGEGDRGMIHRTFALDGEVISDLIRDYRRKWGLARA